MTKWTGERLTEAEFRGLKPGDQYFYTDGGVVRTFKKMAKKRANTAVNTDGMYNELRYMRWQEKVGQFDKEECGDICVKTSNKGDNKMSFGSKALCVVKSDTVDAAWRTAAVQTIRSVKVPFVAFLEKQKLPSGVVGLLLSQLDTDTGEAVLALIVGHTMTYVPQLSCDPKLSRLAKELRVMGMSTFFGKFADAVLNPLRDQLVEAVKMIPFGNNELPSA